MPDRYEVPEGERCHCGWGPVADDDDGGVSGSCATGDHDEDGICTRPAERVFRLHGEDSLAYLCKPCSHVWRDDGDWDYADPEQQFLADTQEELGELALAAARIDLDRFLELAGEVGSPQALALGISPEAVASAGGWAHMAALLKPFHDHARERVRAVREEDSSAG